MTYKGSFIIRWSRRDRLAVLVVAVTVGFLVGATLLVVAGGSQTAALAAGFDAAGSATFVESTAAAPDEALVLPIASIEGPDGKQTIAVGVAEGTDRAFGDRNRRIRREAATTRGTLDEAAKHRLVGTAGPAVVEAGPRSNSLFPPAWYVTSPRVVDAVGETGAIAITERDGEPATGQRDRSVPLRSALRFFAAGTADGLELLGVLVAASGVLVGVTVYSVTRMSVVDRREAIEVARTTGASPWTLLGVFTGRATLLAAVGGAAGYAIGVITVAGAVNISVAAGFPTSIDPRVTAEIARLLVPLVGAVPVIGGIAGGVAAWPTVRRPPAKIGRNSDSGGWALSPRVLSARVLLPTTATLTAFAVFGLLFLAAFGVLLPVLGGGGAVVTQPDAVHPVASQLPEGYTAAFESQGIDASGEILLFGVVDSQPIPARGVVYEDFAAVSDAEIRAGRAPQAPNEAVIGVGAARTLSVEPGETLPLGGSTRVGLTRVTVVGTYTAPPPYGDHILVSLDTARHLTTVGPDRVNLIRGAEQPELTGSGIAVSRVDRPQPAVTGGPLEFTLEIANEGTDENSTAIPVEFAGQRQNVTVSLAPAERTQRTVRFASVDAGEYQLRAGNLTRSVSVVSSDAIRIQGIPPAVPPDSQPQIRVLRADNTPVANASVTVDNTTVRTGEAGYTRVPVSSPGSYQVRARSGAATDMDTITVTEDARRVATAKLSVSPSPADLLIRPTATLRLDNPWSEPVTHEIELQGPNGSITRSVTLQPGEQVTASRQLARQPAGTYTVTAVRNDSVVAEQSYRVSGDDRVAAALATSGRQGSSTFERAIEVALGNVQILGSTLVVLAALMAVGATTASFADAVHARRERLGIQRATGASPRYILTTVLGDALWLGTVSAAVGTGLAVTALWALDRAGLLTILGVRVLPGLSITAIVVVAATGVLITLVGAGAATVSVLRASPADLLAKRRTDGDSDELEL